MSFILAHLDGARTPRAVEKTVVAGSNFTKGALLLVDANGAYAECAANPAAVAAVAESAFGPDSSGFIRTGTKEFPPGFMQGMSVQGEHAFHAQYTGALPAATGGSYPVEKGADGLWRVKLTVVTGDVSVVKLIDLRWTNSPLNVNRVVVTFLPGVVQII
jgi:hypothetical protein